MFTTGFHRRVIAGALAGVAALALQVRPASAQGCVASRLEAPPMDTPGESAEPGKWEVSLSWRTYRSDRHFVGHEEQVNRATEHSQVINRINQPEISITRNYQHGWRFSVGIPYLLAERSSPIRDPNTNVVVDRSETGAKGLGDVTFVGRKWLWDPAGGHQGNISLGFGAKIPTGDNNDVDTRASISSTGAMTLTERTVDQSIQPGDGGFGIILDLQMYMRFAGNRLAAYANGTYLANPQRDSGIRTYRNAPGEEVMSIADQYIARTGIAWYPGSGWGASLGLRAEGVPVYDLIGSSEGFRRPGYSISVEPGASWTRGAHTFSLQAPIAVDRARLVSVADRANGSHGDAAFADFLVVGGYTRRF